MTYDGLKEYLHQVVAGYYGEWHVYFAGIKMPKPPVPYITLKFYGYRKNRTSIAIFDEKNQCNKNYWPARVMVDINLYTKGRNVSPEGAQPMYTDTSEQDLADFLMYISSDFMEDELARNNVALDVEGDIKNLSSLVNESSVFNYRSMVTLKVNFTECSYGKYGQGGRELPNASGGGHEGLLERQDTIGTINITGNIKKEG